MNVLTIFYCRNRVEHVLQEMLLLKTQIYKWLTKFNGRFNNNHDFDWGKDIEILVDDKHNLYVITGNFIFIIQVEIFLYIFDGGN